MQPNIADIDVPADKGLSQAISDAILI